MSEPGSGVARERVIDAMERTATEYGLPRSCGRVYGHLYFAEGPLSLDALVERTGYAKSTVSDAVGTLEAVHLAERTDRRPGQRVYFEPERDLWAAFRRNAQATGRRQVERFRRALDEAEAALDGAPDAESDRRRVRDLRTTTRQAAVALDLLDRFPLERVLGILARFADGVETEDLPDGVDVPRNADREPPPDRDRGGDERRRR